MRRLLIVNAITACLLALGLASEGNFAPAVCLLLVIFSTIGAACQMAKGAAD